VIGKIGGDTGGKIKEKYKSRREISLRGNKPRNGGERYRKERGGRGRVKGL